MDEIHLFKSPILIGEKGKPAIVGKKFENLKLFLIDRKKFKNDNYYHYEVV